MLSRRFLRIKALKSVYSHFTIENETIIESRNKMIFSLNKSYDLYHLLMSLIVEVADYSAEMTEILKNKHLATEQEKNPNMRFVNNTFIQKIRENSEINTYLKDNSLGWENNKEIVREIYQSMITKKYFKKYMELEQDNFGKDKGLVLDFYRNELENNEAFMAVVEDMSLYWIDEVEFITTKVISTFNRWDEESVVVFPLYAKDDDEQFVKDLLLYTVSNYDKAYELIKKYSKNWDSERVMMMDRLIIAMSYSEIVDFPSIPIKATLDEYIELSKYYSTQNSSVYINGILDKIITELKRENKIVKSGAGLQ